jgi:hypothetical protein
MKELDAECEWVGARWFDATTLWHGSSMHARSCSGWHLAVRVSGRRGERRGMCGSRTAFTSHHLRRSTSSTASKSSDQNTEQRCARAVMAPWTARQPTLPCHAWWRGRPHHVTAASRALPCHRSYHANIHGAAIFIGHVMIEARSKVLVKKKFKWC